MLGLYRSKLICINVVCLVYCFRHCCNQIMFFFGTAKIKSCHFVLELGLINSYRPHGSKVRERPTSRKTNESAFSSISKNSGLFSSVFFDDCYGFNFKCGLNLEKKKGGGRCFPISSLPSYQPTGLKAQVKSFLVIPGFVLKS